METPATKTTTARTHDSPLAKLQADAGANMGVWFGCALPSDFGNPEAEYRFAKQSVALLDKNYRAYLSFTGPDRVRYLNAILTNNIKDLGECQGIISLLLNAQGHILAELETYAFDDRHFCVSYAMIREQLISWMDKYIIMDDVTLTDETERWSTLALEGPKAAAAVRELTGIDLADLNELASVDCIVRPISATPSSVLPSLPAQADEATNSSPSPHPDADSFHPEGNAPDVLVMSLLNAGSLPSFGPLPCRIVKRSPGGVAGAEFVVERTPLAAAMLWQILFDAARKHGGGPAGYTALGGQRLAQGAPWFSYDFGEKQIPHEAGLENTHISYTKGCYTGQEIVERVRSRGHVNRRRVTLLFSSDAVPEAGAPLTTADGKEAGYVTRAARIWDPERIIGMGYVRKEAETPGTTLQWPGGTATIVQPAGPFKS